MLADLFRVMQLETRRAGDGVHYFSHRRELRSGEDVGLDPVRIFQVLGKALIGHGDGLEQHGAIAGEQAITDGEEFIVVRVIDGFEHLHADEFVVLPAKLAVVLRKQLDAVAEQPGAVEEIARVVVLVAADRGGGHAAGVMFRRMKGQAAPTRTDFQQMVFRLEHQFPADAFVFRQLCFFQRVLGRGEMGAGIGHRGVEKESKEFVREVVMIVNVFSAASGRIRAQAVYQPHSPAVEGGSAAVTAIQLSHIANGEPRHGHQVRRRPVAVHIAFAHADFLAPENAREEALVVNHNRRSETFLRAAAGVALLGADELEAAVLEALQSPPRKEPSEPGIPSPRARALRIGPVAKHISRWSSAAIPRSPRPDAGDRVRL